MTALLKHIKTACDKIPTQFSNPAEKFNISDKQHLSSLERTVLNLVSTDSLAWLPVTKTYLVKHAYLYIAWLSLTYALSIRREVTITRKKRIGLDMIYFGKY